MKSGQVILLVLTAAVVGSVGGLMTGTALGGLAGTAFGGLGGVASGSILGACVATKTAQEQGLLTPEQANQVIGGVEQKLANEIKKLSEDTSTTTKINCSEALKGIEQQ